jgi:hypothetical protein
VDTEGLVLKAKVHSAKVPDEDGIRLLMEPVRGRLSRLSHLWVDAGYQGRGKRWVGAYLCVDLPQPEDGQRLRAVTRHRGGLCLCGDDSPHGEAFGPCVGVSRQSLPDVGRVCVIVPLCTANRLRFGARLDDGVPELSFDLAVPGYRDP